jgi:3-oxoacyl-(acyl-carrier-protein) synthase
VRIESGECDRVIVSAAEEQSPLVNEAYAHCGHHYRRSSNGAGPQSTAGLPFDDRGFATGCGAVTLILESRDSADHRAARHRAVVKQSASCTLGPHMDARHRIELARRIGESLVDAKFIVSSANATAIDRIELAALAGSPAVITSMAGHIAETFSVTPLAALAAVLLTGRAPRLLGNGIARHEHLNSAAGNEAADSFAILCADYAGGLTVACLDRIK